MTGWVLAGIVSTIAGVFLWPRFEHVMLRKHASKAALAIADLVKAMGSGASRADRDRLTAAARQAEQAARQEFAATSKPPAGPTRSDRAFVELLTELQRIVDIVERPFEQSSAFTCNTTRDVHNRPEVDEAVEGNARLTSSAGIVLLLLFAVIGVTILSIRQLFFPHVFVGFLLIPPVTLKLASTGYRFLHYYGGDPKYRAGGPPLVELRLLAPLVVLITVVVFVSGVALWIGGTDSGWLGRSWLSWHKLSFIGWLFVTGIHVLAYLPRATVLGLADFVPGRSLAGALSRQGLVVAGLLLGLVLAITMMRGLHT